MILTVNVSGQSRTSATIDIRIRIVNSLSSTLIQNGVLGEVDTDTNLLRSENRELLVEYNNRAQNVINELQLNKLTVFDRHNEKIGQTDLNNSVILKNVDVNEKLQFVPAARTKTEEEYSFEPTITIVY